MVTAFLLIIGLFAIRAVDFYLFMKRVSKTCQKYDWKAIDENPELLLEKMNNKDYHLTSKWSAYNFVIMKGPSPLYMFLNFKPLNIETQYNKSVVNRLNGLKIN
jgi:hypothetical protein